MTHNLSSMVISEYAQTLKSKLENYRATDPGCMQKEGDTSVEHLLWMVNELIRFGTLHKEEKKSFSCQHRWLGHVRGVMITMGLTSLANERATYTRIKNALLAQQNLDLYLIRGMALNTIYYHRSARETVLHMAQAANFPIARFIISGPVLLPYWNYTVDHELLPRYTARGGYLPGGCDTLLVGVGRDHDVILGACCGKRT